MATPAAARRRTVTFNGGYVRATRAALDKILNGLTPTWDNLKAGGRGGARRPYGYRRRTAAAAGTPIRVEFTDGEVWTYRVVGPYKKFIDVVLAQGGRETIDAIVTPRGAEFARGIKLDEGNILDDDD